VNTLVLPIPTLSQDPPVPVFELEQPVAVKLAALAFPDGAPLAQSDFKKGGAFVYRRRAGLEEIWNSATKSWEPPSSDLSTLTPLPFTFKAGESSPWSAVLAAAGQKDKDGQPAFDKATGGVPAYYVRGWITATRAGADYAGLSPPTPDFTFVSAVDNQRFGILLTPDKAQGREANQARLQLKNAAQQPVGWVEIRATNGQEVEIVKCDAGGGKLSSVLLADDGTIHLTPAAGKEIVLEGNLLAKRVRYEAAANGALTEL
jgi:hypothetical protein